jgi:hypothetical protein
LSAVSRDERARRCTLVRSQDRLDGDDSAAGHEGASRVAEETVRSRVIQVVKEAKCHHDVEAAQIRVDARGVPYVELAAAAPEPCTRTSDVTGVEIDSDIFDRRGKILDDATGSASEI